MKLDCWPLSLPATLTRSTSTPGIVRMRAQGSRELGTSSSSSLLMVVDVPVRLVSTIGVSDCTVIVSSTDATLRVNGTFTLVFPVTVTSRLTVEKPVRPTVSLWVPWSTFRNLKSPLAPLVVVRLPSAPDRVAVAPGSTAPDSSVTVPYTLPVAATWANATGPRHRRSRARPVLPTKPNLLTETSLRFRWARGGRTRVRRAPRGFGGSGDSATPAGAPRRTSGRARPRDGGPTGTWLPRS